MALSDGILKGWQHWRKDHGKGQEERQGTPSPGRAGHSGKRASDAMPTLVIPGRVGVLFIFSHSKLVMDA